MATITGTGPSVRHLGVIRQVRGRARGSEVVARLPWLRTRFGVILLMATAMFEKGWGWGNQRSLPRGRAVLLAAGVSPVLIRTVPWWEKKYAEEIRFSIERYGPGRRRGPIADLLGDFHSEVRSKPYGSPDLDASADPDEVQPL